MHSRPDAGKCRLFRIICVIMFKLLNMFDRASRPTITESVVDLADSAVESANYWSRPKGIWPRGYGPLDIRRLVL